MKNKNTSKIIGKCSICLNPVKLENGILKCSNCGAEKVPNNIINMDLDTIDTKTCIKNKTRIKING